MFDFSPQLGSKPHADFHSGKIPRLSGSLLDAFNTLLEFLGLNIALLLSDFVASSSASSSSNATVAGLEQQANFDVRGKIFFIYFNR